MALPIVVLASKVEKPILYEQGGQCYNTPIIQSMNDSDNLTEATSTEKVEAVFVKETCVTGVRKLGANVPKGNAIDLETNSPPVVGGVVKLKYGETVDDYHLAYIQAILKTGIYVQEYNYHRKGKYNERFIPFEDESIVGFWSE